MGQCSNCRPLYSFLEEDKFPRIKINFRFPLELLGHSLLSPKQVKHGGIMVFVVVISVFIWLSACFRSELNQVTWSNDFRIGASINCSIVRVRCLLPIQSYRFTTVQPACVFTCKKGHEHHHRQNAATFLFFSCFHNVPVLISWFPCLFVITFFCALTDSNVVFLSVGLTRNLHKRDAVFLSKNT